MQKGFILILVLAIIIGIFAISNNALVPINFIFTKVLLSQAIVIFACVLLGAILASVFGGIRQMSLNKTIRQIKTEKETLQDEVYELQEVIREKDEEMRIKVADIKAKEIISDRQFVDNIDKNELF